MTRFFTPPVEFLKWLAAYARDRLVFDVGCGQGDLVIELQGLGVRACGIEPLWIDRYYNEVLSTAHRIRLSSCIIPVQAEHCQSLHRAKSALVLFCRPAPGSYVSDTLPLLHPGTEVLYITKKANLGQHFDRKLWQTTRLKTPKLREEQVYQVTLRRKKNKRRKPP